MKIKMKFLISCLWAVFLIPLLVTLLLSGIGLEEEKLGLALKDALLDTHTVTVSYNVGTQTLDVEEYLVGMLAPAYDYCNNEEFLKAVAVLGRTYMEYCRENGRSVEYKFYTDEEMQTMWDSSWESNKNAIIVAVAATTGECIYSGENLIFPYAHLLTSGYTRNKEEELDYLCEVAVTGDSLAEDYISTVQLSNAEFTARLQNAYAKLEIDTEEPCTDIQVISKSKGGYILKLQIGNIMVNGDDIAEIFGLKSSSFCIEESDSGVIFTVKGNGLGYGVSLNGAAEMAASGNNYKEILSFYYKNIQIKSY